MAGFWSAVGVFALGGIGWQGWKTFLRNHADGIAAMDLFVVPMISFRLLYGLLIMGRGRRQILWFGVTAHAAAEWIGNSISLPTFPGSHPACGAC